MSNIYYFTPDYDVPSWGIGIIYSHVELLQQNGFAAFVLHQKQPFRIKWLATNSPIRYLNATDFQLKPNDILVVPEILATSNTLPAFPCHRLVLVQGSYFITEGLGDFFDYKACGYKQAITTMPHMQKIIERYYCVPASIIPPFVSPYFYKNPDEQKRSKQIVLVAKPEYYKAGYLDYQIVKKMILGKLKEKHLRGWTLQELHGKSHQEVAKIFQKSTFLVNINSLESFNATIPESMAAGCIPLCYEAYGGRDFLQNEKNAYVFPNNYVYPLLDQVYHLLDNYHFLDQTLQEIRVNAYQTACQYTKTKTEKALIQFYNGLNGDTF